MPVREEKCEVNEGEGLRTEMLRRSPRTRHVFLKHVFLRIRGRGVGTLRRKFSPLRQARAHTYTHTYEVGTSES